MKAARQSAERDGGLESMNGYYFVYTLQSVSFPGEHYTDHTENFTFQAARSELVIARLQWPRPVVKVKRAIRAIFGNK